MARAQLNAGREFYIHTGEVPRLNARRYNSRASHHNCGGHNIRQRSGRAYGPVAGAGFNENGCGDVSPLSADEGLRQQGVASLVTASDSALSRTVSLALTSDGHPKMLSP